MVRGSIIPKNPLNHQDPVSLLAIADPEARSILARKLQEVWGMETTKTTAFERDWNS